MRTLTSHEGAKLGEQMPDLRVAAELEQGHLGGDQERAAARDPLRMQRLGFGNLNMNSAAATSSESERQGVQSICDMQSPRKSLTLRHF